MMSQRIYKENVPIERFPSPTNMAELPWTPCNMKIGGFFDPTFGMRKTFKM